MVMRFERVFAAVILPLALLSVVSVAMAQTKPVPLINQPLVPDAVAPGGPAFTLTVNGTGFVNKSVVEWNGGKRTTTVVSHSQLTATISAHDIATAGTAWVTVVNPAPTGGTSNLAFLTITTSTANVGFRLASSHTTGNDPSSVATGDFNGDGKLDLAVANWGSNTVSILLGDGAGNLTLASSPAVGLEPFSVAVGDFNGDGKLDLAVANSNSNTVSILLGDGTGNFTLASSPSTGVGPVSVAVGDFNEDGKLDLAVVNYSSETVSILLGDGTGNFTLVSSPATGAGPLSVAVGDLNGDGNLDLAVANNGGEIGTVSILLGDGAGNFTLASSPATNGGAFSVAVGDFTGDGKLDLAVAGEPVSILLGDGTGNFTLASSVKTGMNPLFVTVGDFNGDGKLDAAVLHGGSVEKVSILLGDGTGNFALASSPPTGAQSTSMAAGDFNEDGRLDLAVTRDFNMVSVLQQAPAISLSPRSLTFGNQMVGTTSPPQNLTVTDVGYAAVDILGITLMGYDKKEFAGSNNCPTSLAPGANCTISVTFSPLSGESGTARLAVSDSGGNNPPTIFLTGTGLSVELSPTSLNFGSVIVGQTSPPQTVVLTNLSNVSVVHISHIAVKGSDPADFTETNTCGTRVGPGKSCKIVVTFSPTQSGSRTANVNVNDDGGGNPQKIALSGTGAQ